MHQPLKLLFFIGTRPEAIKVAPIVKECYTRPDEVQAFVCHSGQHEHLVGPILDYFGVTIDAELKTMLAGQALASLFAKCLNGMQQVIEESEADVIFVQGDTTTAMAGALAGFYHQKPIVHIEAGLRTDDLYSPWPEEMHRRCATRIATLHCAPTQAAQNVLLEEGVAPNDIRMVGNTVIDALLLATEQEKTREKEWSAKYPFLKNKRLILVTGHRRENLGVGIQNLCEAIQTLAATFSKDIFLYPVHPNPAVDGPVRKLLAGRKNIVLITPPPYPEFVWLMQRSHLIITDSGGVQEEAPSLRKPILITRTNTERNEVVEAGGALLVGTDVGKIVTAAEKLLTDETAYAKMQLDINPFGDGQSSRRVIDWVVQRLN